MGHLINYLALHLPVIYLFIFAIACCAILTIGLETRWLLQLLVAASFTSRVSVAVGQLHLRPEQVLTVMLLARAIVKWRPLPTRKRIQLGLFGFVIVLELLSTVFNSPQSSASLTILLWLFLDFLLLAALFQLVEPQFIIPMLRTGLVCASVTAFAAIGLWLAAAFTGYSGYGVQRDPAYGGSAAYVFSFEANTAAATFALWGLLAIVATRSSSLHRVARPCALLCPIAILATHTRAAALGYIIGLLILVMYGRLRTAQVMVGVVTVVLLAAFVSAIGGSSAGSAAINKFSEFSLGSGDGALRAQSWRLAENDMSQQQLLIGLGTNSFGQRHINTSIPNKPRPAFLGTLPVQILYDAGLIAVLCVFFIFLLSGGINTRMRPAKYALGASYLLLSIATSPFWFSFTWIFLALGATEKCQQAIATLPSSQFHRRPSGMSAVGSAG